MINVNRRSFLWQTSAGAALLAVAAASPIRGQQSASATAPALDRVGEPTFEPIVAYVRNVAAGEIALMVGTREIVVRDAELVGRLLKAAR